MTEFGKIKRIRRINKPGEGDIHTGVESSVRHFIQTDFTGKYNFVIKYISTKALSAPIAVIEVYIQLKSENGVYLPPEKFGVYQSSEWKRFDADIRRATDGNPLSETELTPNILYNGLFNSYPDPLDGWEVDSGAQVTITPRLGRMLITSPIAEGFTILNNKTTIDNLTEYEAILNINKVVNTADVTILIGNTPGAQRTTRGVYTENIISAGDEVMISGNITDPDAVIELEYLIVNQNG